MAVNCTGPDCHPLVFIFLNGLSTNAASGHFSSLRNKSLQNFVKDIASYIGWLGVSIFLKIPGSRWVFLTSFSMLEKVPFSWGHM